MAESKFDIVTARKQLNALENEVERRRELDRRFRKMGINPDQFKPTKPKPSGYIYAIQNESGQIKIGWAKHVEDRLKQLQTGSPKQLHLLGYWRGTKKDESNLHSLIKSLRIQHEWYMPDKHLIDYIKERDESKWAS